MGLPMDNLHTPTVASSATSTAQNGDKKRMSIQELMAEKDRVWSELSALGSVLDSVSTHLPVAPLIWLSYSASQQSIKIIK